MPSLPRIMTCEEFFEPRLPVADWIALQTRLPILEGVGEIPFRRRVKEALRMRPDRLMGREIAGGWTSGFGAFGGRRREPDGTASIYDVPVLYVNADPECCHVSLGRAPPGRERPGWESAWRGSLAVARPRCPPCRHPSASIERLLVSVPW
jgi:hypothetical protein